MLKVVFNEEPLVEWSLVKYIFERTSLKEKKMNNVVIAIYSFDLFFFLNDTLIVTHLN